MDKVRIGLIGTSWWADLMYLPSIRSHEGAEVVAVCGTDTGRTAAFAEKHSVARRYTDYTQMLADGGIDAVIISVPDDLHKQITLAVVDAGLHVMCEKPLALNAADAEEMLARAEAAGVKHSVLFTWRCQPLFRHLKQLLDSGTVGRPLRVSVSFLMGGGHQQNYQWRLDGARATGVLGDLGSHSIDMAMWLVGPISSVSAHAPRLIDRSGFDGTTPAPTNDTAHVTAEFANGAQGLVDVSVLTRLGAIDPLITVRIDGDAGTLDAHFEILGETPVRRILSQRNGESTLTAIETPPELVPTNPADPISVFREQSAGARLFIDSILHDFISEPNFTHGVAVQRVLDAALKSHEERRWVDV
jgi:predicted dehydrogenase